MDIFTIILALSVTAFTIWMTRMIMFIRRNFKEEKLAYTLIHQGYQSQENIFTEVQPWAKKHIKLERKILLIQAGIKPEQAKQKHIRKLKNTDLQTLIFLKQGK